MVRESDTRDDSTRQGAEDHWKTVQLAAREGDSPAGSTWLEVEAHQSGAGGEFRCGRSHAAAAHNAPRDMADSRDRNADTELDNS